MAKNGSPNESIEAKKALEDFKGKLETELRELPDQESRIRRLKEVARHMGRGIRCGQEIGKSKERLREQEKRMRMTASDYIKAKILAERVLKQAQLEGVYKFNTGSRNSTRSIWLNGATEEEVISMNPITEADMAARWIAESTYAAEDLAFYLVAALDEIASLSKHAEDKTT